MELSIIVVNYNTAALTKACVNSILESKPKVDYEIIVVDNGSTEKFETSQIFIKNQKNLGFAKANNQGIKIAKGKYILLLNSDTLVKKGAVDRLYEFAKSRVDAGVVGARLLNKDGSIQDSVFHFPTIARAISEYWFGQKGKFGLYVPQANVAIPVDAVVGAAFLITPKSLERIGGLDERYFMYFEDLDYCRQVWRAGLKVYYLPTSEVIHLKGQSGKELASGENQWKRMIPSSKIYHGTVGYYILFIVMWLGQKWEKLLKTGS